MSEYERAAEQLREFDFCEGCPFVRKTLNLAYRVDNEDTLMRASAIANLGFNLELAPTYGRINRETPCVGSVAVKGLLESSKPFKMCAPEQSHSASVIRSLREDIQKLQAEEGF